MSNQEKQVILLLLVATCTATLVQPGLAQLPPQQIPLFPGLIPPGAPLLPGMIPPGAPLLPGLIPPGAPGDVTQCWASLTSTQGCVMEIYKSIFTLQFGNVGPACCKAFLAIDSSCWPKMFPWNPFFPPLLKGGCASVGALPPPAV